MLRALQFPQGVQSCAARSDSAAHPLFQATVIRVDVLDMEDVIAHALAGPCVEHLVMESHLAGGESERARPIAAKQGIFGDMRLDSVVEIVCARFN